MVDKIIAKFAPERARDGVRIAISLAKAGGVVMWRDAREMVVRGVPVIGAYAALRGVSMRDAMEEIKAKKMTYEHLLIVLGMIYQRFENPLIHS